MPKKKTEEQEVEVTGTDETAPAATETDEQQNGGAEAAAEEPGVLESVAETVVAAAETVAEAVSEGVASVVSAVTGSDETTGQRKTGKRAERIGIVQSDKMTKTVVVRVDRQVKHPIYRKYIKRRKKFMAHDELGAGIGDKVRIIETRPLSARKRWRVVEIIQKAEK